MPTPNVSVTKIDGNTGVVAPTPLGNLAIMASSAKATPQVPATFNRPSDAYNTDGLGPLTEYGAYFMQQAKNPCLLIAPSTSIAPTIYGTGRVWGGTSVPAFANLGTGPVDEYHPIWTCVAGGTIGVAGITYNVSLDGGQTVSATLALGTANSLNLVAPVTGDTIGLTLNFGAGTVQAGDQVYCYTTRPMPNNADLVGCLEALRVTKAPWDNLLVDTDCTAAQVGTVDAWLSALQAVGVYKMAWMNTRHKNRPVPTTESESAYAAYLGTLLSNTSSINIDVGADAAEIPSSVTGIMQPRPTSLFVATRAEMFAIGVDPAEVDNGPLGGGLTITSPVGNPTWHDEQNYPGLDGLRLSTLRSIPGKQGVYITNANVLSPSGSDYVYDQHVRVMNAACYLAFAILTGKLSKGVRKQPPNPITGAIYILENDAQQIEAAVNRQLRRQLKGQCNAAAFVLSRVDDLSANTGATLNGQVQIQALAYIKNFKVTAAYVRFIAVPVTPAPALAA